jgi:predicted dehydrogenase
MARYRSAIIACGVIARCHARGWQRVPDVELAAIADTNREALDEFGERNDATPHLPSYADNSLGVFEFDRALAIVDIAAMEPRPTARRFEVYGTYGSAITEPFDTGRWLRLTLEEATGEFAAGEQVLELPIVTRQEMYDRELAAFAAAVRGAYPPDRSPEHELLVQETLLRGTGRIT